jgi:hypothetical protein
MSLACLPQEKVGRAWAVKGSSRSEETAVNFMSKGCNWGKQAKDIPELSLAEWESIHNPVSGAAAYAYSKAAEWVGNTEAEDSELTVWQLLNKDPERYSKITKLIGLIPPANLVIMIVVASMVTAVTVVGMVRLGNTIILGSEKRQGHRLPTYTNTISRLAMDTTTMTMMRRNDTERKPSSSSCRRFWHTTPSTAPSSQHEVSGVDRHWRQSGVRARF